MKIFALGSITKPLSPEQRQQIMTREVPATLGLYLDGTIEQFWARTDAPGVVFLLEAESVEQARRVTSQLPLVEHGFAIYDFIPVGPLAPLGALIQK